MPRDESSSLIDLRTLSQMAAPAASSASSLALPRFAAGDLTRIPVPPPSRIESPLPPPQSAAEDRAPIIALLISLTIAVVALAAYVALRPPPKIIVHRALAAAPAVDQDRTGDAAEPEPEPEPEPRPPPEADEPPPVLAVAGPNGGEPNPEPPEKAERRRVDKRALHRDRDRRRDRTPADRSPPPTRPPKPELTADCILGLADCERAPATASPTPRPTKREASGSLPDKPSTSQIRKSLAARKPIAKRCRTPHAATPGTKVRVKLSIAGDTGRVTSADPRAPHEDALGRCVADALRGATFPRFARPAMGLVYTVTL